MKDQILRKADIFLSGMISFFTPSRILFLAVSFAALWSILFLAFNTEIYRDVAGCYAWYGREFGRGHWDSVHIAGLPPLNIFLCGLMVKCGFEAYCALIVISCVCYIMTIFPLYGILKNLVPEKIAAWGCLLFVMTPKIIRFVGNGLLESTRDFLLVSAVYILFLLWRNKASWYHWIMLGITLGLLALSRGEGIVASGLIFAGLLIRPLADYKSWRLVWRKIFLPAVVVAVTALGLISPRLIETWKTTGYPVTDSRCIGLIRSLPLSDRLFQDKRVPVFFPEDQMLVVTQIEERQNIQPGLFCRILEYCGFLMKQMSRGGYEVYLIFAAIGVFALIWKRTWRKEYSWLLGFSLVFSMIIGVYSMAYRYFVFLIPLLMIFTLNGLCFLLEWAEKVHLRAVALIAVACLILIQPVNAWGQLLKQENGTRELQMARFLKENRAAFLPSDEKDRKLVLYAHSLPEIIYRLDEGRVGGYGDVVEKPGTILISGFDAILIPLDEAEACRLLQKQKNLKVVHHPLESEFLLMAPCERGER